MLAKLNKNVMKKSLVNSPSFIYFCKTIRNNENYSFILRILIVVQLSTFQTSLLLDLLQNTTIGIISHVQLIRDR